GAHDVAKQHADLLQFAGKRVFDIVQRSGSVGLRRAELFQTRSTESCPALAAEFVLGRVSGAARRTDGAERRTALSTKVHAGGVVGATRGAPHADPPQGAGLRVTICYPNPRLPERSSFAAEPIKEPERDGRVTGYSMPWSLVLTETKIGIKIF